MDDLDMSGVDPLRYDEVRRRVRVVKDYLSLPSPTEPDLKTHAVLLDLSVNQFKALVRAWREYQSPAKMAASGAHRGGTRAPNRLDVAPEAKQAAAEVIEEYGPSFTLAKISGVVRERCERRGVTPPSGSTIWLMVRAVRQHRGTDEDGVVIGTCLVPLPTEGGAAITQPMLTIAVRATDKVILAASLADADWQTAALAIAATSGSGTRVRVDKELLKMKHADSLQAGLEPMAGAKVRTVISRILGAGIGDLRLIIRPGKAMAPERLLTTKEDRPLSPADARAVIKAAIVRHNQTRGAREACWIDVSTTSPYSGAA